MCWLACLAHSPPSAAFLRVSPFCRYSSAVSLLFFVCVRACTPSPPPHTPVRRPLSCSFPLIPFSYSAYHTDTDIDIDTHTVAAVVHGGDGCLVLFRCCSSPPSRPSRVPYLPFFCTCLLLSSIPVHSCLLASFSCLCACVCACMCVHQVAGFSFASSFFSIARAGERRVCETFLALPLLYRALRAQWQTAAAGSTARESRSIEHGTHRQTHIQDTPALELAFTLLELGF